MMRWLACLTVIVATSAPAQMLSAATVTGLGGNDLLTFTGVTQTLGVRTVTTETGHAITIPAGEYWVNSETYDGLAGTDTLLMSNRADYISQEAGDVLKNMETVIAGAGTDIIDLSATYGHPIPQDMTIDVGSANDVIIANNGNDTLRGGSGGDILYGGAGHDLLIGQAGDDTLIGGLGSDTYNMSNNVGGHDTIFADFDDGSIDWIDFGINAFSLVLSDSTLVDYDMDRIWWSFSYGSDTSANIGTITLVELRGANPNIGILNFFADSPAYLRALRPDIPPQVPLPASAWMLAAAMAFLMSRGIGRIRRPA